jgi:hypothetical protein
MKSKKYLITILKLTAENNAPQIVSKIPEGETSNMGFAYPAILFIPVGSLK